MKFFLMFVLVILAFSNFAVAENSVRQFVCPPRTYEYLDDEWGYCPIDSAFLYLTSSAAVAALEALIMRIILETRLTSTLNYLYLV
ncbi:uncharacterized protein OCT59_014027 [Rhizophagus irregularis]|uniref:uncharacterized protein n=1 Tax=Rhizophagus irregularis TaxID=588596 RepID=UPI00332892D6|nr:hypothetical protein OCT59_014027 [Rhizophagus irregularis]